MSPANIVRTFLRVPSAIRTIRNRSESDPLVLFRSAAASGLFPPLQLESEFVPLLRLLRESRPSTILEIGTCRGGSLFLLGRMLTPGGHLMSIDLPGGPFGGGFPAWKIPLFRSFVAPDQTLTLLRGDSHAASTVQVFEQKLGDRHLDVLFIDGDHSYEGVSRDYSIYSKYVRPGGMIIFHDIVEGPMAGDVHRFWNEVKVGHSFVEFVEQWDQGSCGLGILWNNHTG